MAEMLELPDQELAAALAAANQRGVLARGLGRCYGDAAQNAGGLVLRLQGAVDQALIDPVAATATVPAGVSIDELLHHIVPRGWFVPVTAGTRLITVGGAVGSDIHGKNHHVDGSFGNHVVSLRLMLADGSVVTVAPDRDPELFWATIGGMGLTGIVLAVTFRLLPIETSRMSVDTRRMPDLDSLLAEMSSGDDAVRYSVAWVDMLARGRSLGRGVLDRGEHASLAQLSEAQAAAPLAYRARQLVSVPPVIPPSGLLNHLTVAAFNEFWFRKTPTHSTGHLKSIPGFFHPLDMVGDWNRLYGANGFLQYQFVVPFGAEQTLRAVIERVATSGAASFLAVLKRFGAGNLAPLSFPTPGWTLTLDIPARAGGVVELLHELDRMVLDAGGRHYLAKDATTTPEAIRRGYPRLAEWQAVQARVDPGGRWQSDLARRLRLTVSTAGTSASAGANRGGLS